MVKSTKLNDEHLLTGQWTMKIGHSYMKNP